MFEIPGRSELDPSIFSSSQEIHSLLLPSAVLIAAGLLARDEGCLSHILSNSGR